MKSLTAVKPISAGREYKMKGNFLRAQPGKYPNQASFSNRSHGNLAVREKSPFHAQAASTRNAEFPRP